jgi:glutathione S-transferase
MASRRWRLGALSRDGVAELRHPWGLHKSFSPLFNAAFDATAKALQSELLRKKFEWVASKLTSGSFLTREQFTAADAYLFTVTRWANHVKLDLPDLANLQAFLARVAARPAVQAAIKAEGLPG